MRPESADDRSPASAAWAAVAEAAGIGRETSVLDVGCGTGGFCRFAAARGALAHGVDADPGRVTAARRSAPDAVFKVARLERLPWPDGSFDVVTGFNVFQYAGDVDGAIAEARRVTRDLGLVAVCKWGLPATNEFFAFLGSLDPSRFTLRRPPAVDVVDRTLDRLRVRIVASGEVQAPIAFDGYEALAAALASSGARAEPEDASAWRGRVTVAAAPFRQADGGFRFENRLLYRVFVV